MQITPGQGGVSARKSMHTAPGTHPCLPHSPSPKKKKKKNGRINSPFESFSCLRLSKHRLIPTINT